MFHLSEDGWIMMNNYEAQTQSVTIPDDVVSVSSAIAKDALRQLWLKEQQELENFYYTSAAFCLFIETIHIVSHAGWSEEELLKEVKDHVSIFKKRQHNVSTCKKGGNR
jgi:hypothetical protein